MNPLHSRLTPSLLCLGLVCLANCPLAWSQTAAAPDKAALIKELMQVTQIADVANQTLEAMMGEIEKQMLPLFDSIAPRVEGQSSAERQRKLKVVTDKFIQNFRTELPKQINLGKITEDIVTPIYDQMFNVSDLRELLAFYRTPTGQKAVKLIPQIALRSSQETEKHIKEPVTELTKKLMQEVFQDIEREFQAASDQGPPPPPPPKKP